MIRVKQMCVIQGKNVFIIACKAAEENRAEQKNEKITN